MIRSVSLDLGGTLLTEVPPRFEIYACEARREGFDVGAERMKGLMRAAHSRLPRELDGAFRYSDPWFERFIAEIFAGDLGLGAERLPAVTERLFERFESPATFRLFPGVEHLLEGLRSLDLRVGVLSNWSARLPRVLAAVGLDGAFDFVVCSALDRVEKPDPRAFLLAAERAGVLPSELCHAGDRVDLDGAARRAGCEFVHVRHPGADDTTMDPGPRSGDDVQSAIGLAALLDRITERVR
jgi:HAD superfamily hydrolase (TIGR01509 family)